jgi:hypothetical protein
MTAQTVWLPTSSRPVSQQPSRKNPVMGFIEQISSRPPSTLRGVLGRSPPLPLSLSIPVSACGVADRLTRKTSGLPPIADIEERRYYFRKVPDPDIRSRLGGSVQGEIEDVEVAQPPMPGDRAIGRVERTRQHERNRLLRQAAMRAQSVAGEPGKVVLVRP